MALELRTINQDHVSQLQQLILANPIRHCYAASRIELMGISYFRHRQVNIVGAFDGDQLVSALMFGANLVPIDMTQEALDLFGDLLVRQGRQCSSIVGSAFEVFELWNRVKDSWGSARQIRNNQPVLATASYSALEIDEQVRYSTSNDIDILFPACVEMFTQEVGISPISSDNGLSYRNRISELIDLRRSFIRVDDGEVVFKTEVGCIGASVAQLQGVWVKSEERGQGVGQHAMATVVKRVLDDIAPIVSLYVNDYNKSAIAMYEKVGFKQVDRFATILF